VDDEAHLRRTTCFLHKSPQITGIAEHVGVGVHFNTLVRMKGGEVSPEVFPALNAFRGALGKALHLRNFGYWLN